MNMERDLQNRPQRQQRCQFPRWAGGGDSAVSAVQPVVLMLMALFWLYIHVRI